MISQKIIDNCKSASMIRAMFEEGESLKKMYGAENVYDFSLGNPDPEPPQAMKDALKKIVLEDMPRAHGYMNNAGYPDVREVIAKSISAETGKKITQNNIVMAVGAGGGMNVLLKTILNPGEEVIVFKPYFGEYKFYIDNNGGQMVEAETDLNTFNPDLNSFEKSINNKTKAVIINSPNNPTGIVYSKELLGDMAKILTKKELEFNHEIYVISDEPYGKVVFDNVEVPNVFNIFKNAIIINSFSKSHSIPGERIGYIAVNESIDGTDELIDGLIFATRTLGFVNAPALFQRAVALSLDSTVDTMIYQERRDILYNHLIKLGFTCVKPQGAFYLFPKSPIADDVKFKEQALKHRIIVVPGSGFRAPGHFRIAYCTSLDTIKNSLPAFEALAKEFKF